MLRGIQEIRSIATEIAIAAPPEDVWRVLVEFSRYPEWSPFLLEIAGEAVPGAWLRLRIRAPGRRRLMVRAHVLAAEPGRLLRWTGALWCGLFRVEHIFRLEPRRAGCVLHQALHCRGLLPGLLGAGLFTDLRQGAEALNDALKHRAEVQP
ncbi:SRPBCC domain-containing protein [Roseomonas sp. GC11]|uniref:SRPBCC domain-containing protein n=1 Tax=Roseomonas sp. GC11 TaxID=2950546 RepID=UPI00210E95B5|nr:SRPBCC domain-containing protein [Roseomonas sp. GC11]MCQ4159727.1 SRPBCC domain-containing protein [Roseomonas sp. GC11]